MSVDTDALIDDWFNANFYNSALSRNTDAFNVASAARDDLKSRLKVALGTPAAAPAPAPAPSRPTVTEDNHGA